MKAFLILFVFGLALTATLRTKLHLNARTADWKSMVAAIGADFETEGSIVAAGLEKEKGNWDDFFHGEAFQAFANFADRNGNDEEKNAFRIFVAIARTTQQATKQIQSDIDFFNDPMNADFPEEEEMEFLQRPPISSLKK